MAKVFKPEHPAGWKRGWRGGESRSLVLGLLRDRVGTSRRLAIKAWSSGGESGQETYTWGEQREKRSKAC